MLSNKERKLERMTSGISDNITANVYNLVLGACVLYGLIMNAILVATCGSFVSAMNPVVIIVGYFISVILGTIILVISYLFDLGDYNWLHAITLLIMIAGLVVHIVMNKKHID